jgi:hypothetical protein
MNALLVFFAALILLMPIICAQQSNSVQEDQVTAEATVQGFARDFENNSYVQLHIDNITKYDRSYPDTFPRLLANETALLGFLWGHRPVSQGFPELAVGDRIIADLGIHARFSSHSGHVYAYELICRENQVKISGACVPSECGQDEILTGIRCLKLSCMDTQYATNHTCAELNCSDDERVLDHKCLAVVCEADETAENHTCLKLTCNEGTVATNHSCSALTCGLLYMPGKHDCVLDWRQILVAVVFLFFFTYIIYTLFLEKLIENKSLRKKELGGKFILILILALTALVIMIPHLARFNNHNQEMVGEESYKSASAAQDLIDGAAVYSPFGQINSYDLIIGLLGRMISIEWASRIIPLILGVLSSGIFFLVIRKLTNPQTSLISTLILIASPPFIYLFTTSAPESLIAFIAILSLALAITNRLGLIIISGILSLSIIPYSLFIFLLMLGMSLYCTLSIKSSRRTRVAISITLLLIGGIFYLSHPGNQSQILVDGSGFLSNTISDMGAVVGFGVFNLLLVFFGLIATWGEKRRYALLYLFMIGMTLLLLIMNTHYSVFINFIFSFLGGLGLVMLLKRRWEIPILKIMTILVIFCGLMFSAISYEKRISTMPPDSQLTDGLNWLRTQEDGTVLSHPSNGYWIRYFSGKMAFLNNELDTDEQINISNDIFYSRDLAATNSTLSEQGIKYIVIDQRMRQGLVWNRDNQGLLFLLRNNETFKQIYSNKELDIWLHLG